eukprot:GHVQ01035398.1.p1 GENE.GHVQ01035398.1~~GHVQ01035398.1.p1  ORF type:complete len:452 (-),score=69.14 GHVQ01035398.1:250-1605(-)
MNSTTRHASLTCLIALAIVVGVSCVSQKVGLTTVSNGVGLGGGSGGGVGSTTNRLRHLSDKSISNVIKLDRHLYNTFVLGVVEDNEESGSAGETFDMVILYTTDDAKLCVECKRLNRDFEAIANEYHRYEVTEGAKKDKGGKGEGYEDGGLVSELIERRGGSSRDLFFAKMDLLDDRSLLKIHRFSSVPLMVYINSRTFKKTELNKYQTYVKHHTTTSERKNHKPPVTPPTPPPYVSINQPDIFSLSGHLELTHVLEKALNWLNLRTNRQVIILPTATQQLTHLCQLLMLLTTAAVLLYVVTVLCNRYPILVALGGWGVQLLGTCGLFYCMQNGVGWVGWGGRGAGKGVEWVARTTRRQYVGEGLAMGGCGVICGALVLAAVYSPTWRWLSKRSNWLRQGVVLFLLVVFTSLLLVPFQVHKYKSGGYVMPSMMPPADFVRGPLMMDRGNVF